MRILVTGAAGMLGTDVARLAGQLGHDVTALGRSELDVTNAGAVSTAIAAARPEAVVNCAAWTDVDGAESAPGRAAAVNHAAAGQVAAAASAAGAWTIHVSTDYVFDGTKRDPYVESDAVAPSSVYGETKLAGERAVAEAAPESHTIVRSSWLFGASGHCFPKTMLRLAGERDRLAVVDDQVGCPTFTGHLAAGLIALAVEPTPGVLHVAAEGECSWCDFAREILRTAGVDTPVDAITTDQFPRPAARPAYSVLRSERDAPPLPDWRTGLNAFFAETASEPVTR